MATVLRAVSEPPPKIMRISDYAGGRDRDLPGIERAQVPLLTLEQLREQSKAVSWLVKHTVPADSIGIIFGGSGTFKSFIALDMALHVAHGLEWLGKKTKKGAVLIVAAEGGAGLWKRIVAWHRKRRLKWTDAAVYVVPVSVDLTADSAGVTVAAEALGIKPDLVIIDTLSQTFNGEENSAGEIASYLREIGLWFRASWQCAVLVVHHTGHVATERPRGSSALRSNVDFMFGVFRDEKEMLATVECVKQKDGELFESVSFAMSVEELEFDEDGDAITSLVASAVNGNEAIEIMSYEAKHGRGGQKQQFLDMALDGMEEKKLRTIFYEVIDGDGAAKRQAFNRARSWAIKAGLIEVAKGVIIRLRRAD